MCGSAQLIHIPHSRWSHDKFFDKWHCDKLTRVFYQQFMAHGVFEHPVEIFQVLPCGFRYRSMRLYPRQPPIHMNALDLGEFHATQVVWPHILSAHHYVSLQRRRTPPRSVPFYELRVPVRYREPLSVDALPLLQLLKLGSTKLSSFGLGVPGRRDITIQLLGPNAELPFALALSQ